MRLLIGIAWLVLAVRSSVLLQSCESKAQDTTVDSHQGIATKDASVAAPRQAQKAAAPVKYSPRIQKLYQRAQSGLSIPIHDIPVPFADGGTQGTNRPTPDGRMWDVEHNYGKSNTYDEAVFAHELTHIVLMNKGFLNGSHMSKDGPRPSYDAKNHSPALYLSIKTIGPGSFVHELIDREMAKEGFKPQLLVEDEMRQMENGASQFNPNEEEVSDEAREAYALQLFEVGMRISVKSMRSFEERYKRKFGPDVGPDIVGRERKLSQQFQGQKCHINDPSNCFRLTLRLRDAAGMHGVMFFYNPASGNFE